ncbi:hypothetical protein [Archangium sp. Cb G35]|uniref:hypothetical protein n=1 Tax=Archangium sp. Cb G35 TaxID=1920190 RepID=UPI000AE5D8CF|nr:hypothetical protein [Archangium sp. Cb G35]
MKFTRAQLDEWLQRDPEQFVERVLERVREQHPTLRSTDDMLRDSIRAGVKRARVNGLRSDRQVSEFILIMFEVAPNFDQQKDIRQMLDDTSLPVEERWERLFTPAFDAAWDEADQPGFLDAGAWFETPPKDLSEVGLPSLEEWAEVVVLSRIAQQTPPGQPLRSPTLQELYEAAVEIEQRVKANKK